MALPYSDTFLQTSGGVQALATYNAGWASLIGGFQVPDAVGEARSTTNGENVARWGTDAPNADHYAEIITATGWAATGVYVGAAVRAQSGAATAYYVYGNGTAWELIRLVAGAASILASGSWTATDGQPIRIEAVGVGTTVSLTVKKAGATVTTFNDTAGNRITTAGFGGIAAYDITASSPSIASFTVDNLGAGSSEISGNATVDEPGAGGGMASAADLSGNATIDEPTAGGGMGSAGASEVSGDAQVDEPGAGGGMESAAQLSGDATVDEPTAGGGMSGAGGTITSSDLKDNGTGVHSNAPFEARVYAAGDGSLVLRKTGLTSTTSATAPACSFLDAAVVTGQQYYVQWIRTDTGQYGVELLTAT